MGLTKSKTPLPPPPLLNNEWRRVPWGEYDREFVKTYEPHQEEQHLRILLFGPVGAGKSSFINSVDSVLRGQVSVRASAENSASESFTKTYSCFKIQKGKPGTFYPFVFCDTMGLETEKSMGANVDNIILAIKGHMREGYKFNSSIPMADNRDHYNQDPDPESKIHVLVCLFSANTVAIADPAHIEKIKKVRAAASENGIPQVVILTKVDEACPEVRRDVKNVYKSKYLKEKVEQCSKQLGFPVNCIFMVKNYSTETETDPDMNALIMNAMRKIINYGEDYLSDVASCGK